MGAVQLLPVGVNPIGRIDGFCLAVSPEAESAGGPAVEVVVLQMLPRAKDIGAADLARVPPLLQLSEIGPGIGNALTNSRLDLR